ncbi:hypothetical protein O3P69_013804 [Scylla paramamosain]|uniref:Uncharacterized protein n=1 Tax=Scylla paramamosain TaxID=85552 RepID=A0AAW0SQS0_SCYPA
MMVYCQDSQGQRKRQPQRIDDARTTTRNFHLGVKRALLTNTLPVMKHVMRCAVSIQSCVTAKKLPTRADPHLLLPYEDHSH